MPRKVCFVPKCVNNSEENSNKVFITIPSDPKTRAKWFSAVNAPILGRKDIFCCEDHFDMERDAKNWMHYKLMGSRIFMKDDVYPHKYLEKSRSPTESSQFSPSARKRKMKMAKEHADKLKKSLLLQKISDARSGHEIAMDDPPTVSQSKEIQSPGELITFSPKNENMPSTSSHFEPVSKKNKKVQVNIKPSMRGVSTNTNKILTRSVSTTTLPDKTTKRMTEISSTERSETGTTSSMAKTDDSSYVPSSLNRGSLSDDNDSVQAQVYQRTDATLLITKSRFYVGLPTDASFLIELITNHVNLTMKEVLICLKKIRLNDANVRLADDFGVSKAYIAKTFKKTIPVLAAIFKRFIFWQKAIIIAANLPIPFRYRYRKVQSIIDCLEIEIEVSSDPYKQAQTWSEYKKCNTMKYLISATPNGSINFISRGYGDRATDKVITEQSGFLDALPDNADVMADRGFKQVAGLLENKNCRLVRPPTVLTSEKPSKDQVKESKRVAALRIHIERVIRRFREFKMLKMHACVNHKMLYLLDHIMIIACGIVNTQHVLIK